MEARTDAVPPLVESEVVEPVAGEVGGEGGGPAAPRQQTGGAQG